MNRQRIGVVCCLCTLLVLPTRAQNPGDVIFAGIQVHDINIRFAQPAYWDSLTTYYLAGNEQYMAATAIVDGVHYDSIGVRLKGNSSYAHPNNKKSFRLAFDEYHGDCRWDGLKGIHLNNCWGDPTFMREKVHLDFCRDAGISAPRGDFARLSINDTLFAFYSLVEHVDKRFLGSRFGSDEGDLFKAVDGIGTTLPVLSDLSWFGAVADSYYVRYEFKTDGSVTGWPNLLTFLDTLNNSTQLSTSLPHIMNLPSVYKAFAADNMFANLDSYAGSGRNFYLYFPPSAEKIEWIVWDTGLSFGAYAVGVSDMENLSLTYASTPASRPLLRRVLESTPLRNDYLHTYANVFTRLFTSARLFPHIDSIATVIRPYVAADPRKMYTLQQFETNIVADITAAGGAGTKKPGLKSFITSRQTNVQTQLINLGITGGQVVNPGDLVINEFIADNDSLLDPAGEADDWLEIYNATADTLDLGGMFLTDAPAQPAKWTFPSATTITPHGYLVVWADEDSGQAGIHANFKLSAGGEYLGLANTTLAILDSITFGAQVTNRSMARIPNGTGGFQQCPPTPGAANSNGSGLARGDVVINEFCADNDSIYDPAGETDDWIELYNTTSHDINLSGLNFSDSFSKPSKWQFLSGTTIHAHEFLVVWADQDTGQPGIHAAFALSASGEAIVLSNKDLSIVDSISFGIQTTNLSMARIPDGTGPFVRGRPTMGMPNVTTSATETPPLPTVLSLAQNYPNPFNPVTTIAFSLPVASPVTLEVYSLIGSRVATLVKSTLPAGTYTVPFSASSLSSGVYLYRLTAVGRTMVKKLVVLK
jgi:hypothetical protein